MEHPENTALHSAANSRKVVPVQTYFDVYQGILGIYLTNKCNIECSHCSVNSGPREVSHLAIDSVIKRLPSAVREGIVKGVHVSGGEPFLYQEDLRQIALAGHQLGILVGINTNAFWARDLSKARRLLRSIKQITQLLISTDIYHEQFLPLECIKNAAVAGIEEGIRVQVGVCTPRGERNEFVDRVFSVIGNDLSSQLDILIFPLEPTGRAMALPEAQWRQDGPNLPEGKCDQLNRPVVLEDGTVLACCNTTVSKRICDNSPLKLGNIRDLSIEDMHAESHRNYVIQCIRSLGPKFLAERLIAEGFGNQLTGMYSSRICSLCSDMMSKPTLVRELSRIFDTPSVRREVAVACAARLNDLILLKDIQRQELIGAAK